MKKIFVSIVFVFAAAFSAVAQEEMNSKGQPVVKSKDNAPVELKTGETIRRGAALTGNAKKVSLAKVMKDPQKYAGKAVRVEGLIVRSCKKEGCWAELAANKDAKPVRVTFGDHAFFIPLNAAGMTAKAEGVFEVKTLSKEQVDHLIKDDGAKVERNADGTANEITFVATGVELTKK
ncbi:MAG TPA: DUF4920 domain-containing protein [Pyrinomonadaceae bacterium]|nr:DUF4920 domain-containing protein [Pyrinomonadaceae bacterium]